MTKKPRTLSTAKKAPAKKTGIKKKDAVWEKLAKELKLIIPKLDSEGLAFLVEQSRIHLYNMQVDDLNRMKQEAYANAKKKSGGKTKTVKTQSSKTEFFGVDATSAGYYLRCTGGGTMFSKSEMVQMVKIAHGPGSAQETGTRLYSWFTRERSDVLSTLQITDRLDKKLLSLAAFIKKNFKVKS
ncbi:MAG: hypothetical protein LBU88_04220 [Treponema sp.]|jgi:hypothetical protein|nr:hypothetical protein [Treponema sp.]